MNAEFFEALAMLEKERGLPADYLLEKIKNAIVIAVKKDYEVEDENVSVVIEPDQGKFSVSLLKTVVEEVEDPATEISLEEAQQKKKSCKAGDEYAIPLKTKDFGRIAAQTAKHVIRQGLKEAERSQMYAEMQSKAHEIISAVVTNIEPVKGIVTLELGKGGVATLPRNEQVAGEELREGQHVKVYVVDVMETERGPRMMISRTHPGLVKRMFEMEVPEIFDGTVEIKAISREAGARTKMAVWSKDENVDPVGACIGPRGQRVANIVEELGGEKIDIVRWSEDPAQFISAALKMCIRDSLTSLFQLDALQALGLCLALFLERLLAAVVAARELLFVARGRGLAAVLHIFRGSQLGVFFVELIQIHVRDAGIHRDGDDLPLLRRGLVLLLGLGGADALFALGRAGRHNGAVGLFQDILFRHLGRGRAGKVRVEACLGIFLRVMLEHMVQLGFCKGRGMLFRLAQRLIQKIDELLILDIEVLCYIAEFVFDDY